MNNEEKLLDMFTLAYDVPSENVKVLKAAEGENADVDKEKVKKKLRLQLQRMRLNFWATIWEYGRKVNNSVFIIPEGKVKPVQAFIDRTLREYEAFFEENKDFLQARKPSISLIQFHGSEEERLRLKAQEALLADLKKLHEEIDSIQVSQTQNMKTRGVKPNTVKKMRKTIDQVLDLKQGFKIQSPNILEHARLLKAKLDEVRVME
jgi:hypothetical protein